MYFNENTIIYIASVKVIWIRRPSGENPHKGDPVLYIISLPDGLWRHEYIKWYDMIALTQAEKLSVYI